MVTMRRGERISRGARLRLSCAAAVFDAERRILVTRRRDNGRWCLPAGGVDPGESVSEACEREVWEETGLVVRVTGLIGVYSDPHRVFEYADGNRWHLVDLLFRAGVHGGALRASQEVSQAQFCAEPELHELDLMEHDRERLADAFARCPEAAIQ
jgi:8-oxo-dGTP pyrophosphatase MutT (NUDIX family)